MKKYKVTLLVFSESYSREDVYQQRKPVQDREVQKLLEVFAQDFELIYLGQEIRSKKEGVSAAAQVQKNDSIAVLLYIPMFINPAVVAHTAALINKPIALLGNMAPDSFSQVGYLAAAGAMEQIGISFKRVVQDSGTYGAVESLKNWINASAAALQLKGQTFGVIGGRSLGISTGTADVAQWENQFGVDIEHIDQMELVRRAEMQPASQVKKYVQYIHENYGLVQFDNGVMFGPAHLEKMIRSYLAAKSIIMDYELDFAGIKCQPELSNGYCLQCLTIQMLNDPYDAEGMKEPFVCSCEADADGAMSMQILKMISQGKPTALQDIYRIGSDEFILANCGAMASSFASLSLVPRENLSQVHLVKHGFGLAGGAATQFVCAQGEFTFMRLYRRAGKYCMGVFKGETIEKPREILSSYSPYRPTSFVRHHVDAGYFMEKFCSNHLHCVQGDYEQDLKEFCKIMNIQYEQYD